MSVAKSTKAEERRLEKERRDILARPGDTAVLRVGQGKVEVLRVVRTGLKNEKGWRSEMLLSDGTRVHMFHTGEVTVCPKDQKARAFAPLRRLIRAIERLQRKQRVPSFKRLDLAVCVSGCHIQDGRHHGRYTLVDKRTGQVLNVDATEKSSGEFRFVPESGWEETELDQYDSDTSYMIGNVDVSEAVAQTIDTDEVTRYC